VRFLIKIILSSVVLVCASEVAKRSTVLGAVITSLPLSSLMVFIWLYLDTGDMNRVADLSRGIFWMLVPSLTLFIVLPFLLKRGWPFYGALASASGATAIAYFAMMRVLMWLDG
jgi:hypothetical protein